MYGWAMILQKSVVIVKTTAGLGLSDHSCQLSASLWKKSTCLLYYKLACWMHTFKWTLLFLMCSIHNDWIHKCPQGTVKQCDYHIIGQCTTHSILIISYVYLQTHKNKCHFSKRRNKMGQFKEDDFSCAHCVTKYLMLHKLTVRILDHHLFAR